MYIEAEHPFPAREFLDCALIGRSRYNQIARHIGRVAGRERRIRIYYDGGYGQGGYCGFRFLLRFFPIPVEGGHAQIGIIEITEVAGIRTAVTHRLIDRSECHFVLKGAAYPRLSFRNIELHRGYPDIEDIDSLI